ncbi:MAG: taurine dioxygenase [Gammaproteobacteria bacterium]|nr:taurine dioxygenase [Gammaproteobacteria bacterium]
MEIRQHSEAVGAQVSGVDVRNLGDDQFAELRDAFHRHGVLFFHEQSLTPEDHIAFAQRWGPININRFFRPVDGYPQIAEVLKEPDQTANIGGGWHTDHSYDHEPAMGSVLYALEIPEVGGDTLFAGMGAAYAALDDETKERIAGLHAEHSNRHVFGAEATYRRGMDNRLGNPDLATQDAVHPIVINHPATGEHLLYVNPGFTRRIVELEEEESSKLLWSLYQHAMKPEFHTRWQWQEGSLAMWDNRSTWHFAQNDYQGQRRYLHRITIEGTRLTGAAT